MSAVIVSFVLFATALTIWIVLSFSQKRIGNFQNVCGSRPGVVSPINFLNPRHRLVYTVACAAQSSLWLQLLFISWNIDTIGNKWTSLIVKAIYLVLLSIVVVILTYPVLACVEAPIPILGYVLGLLYSVLYLILRLYMIFSSLDASNSNKSLIIGTAISQLLPEVVCMITVILWYTYKTVKECKRIVGCGEFWKMAIFEQPPSLNHHNYVKHLLNSNNIATTKRLSFLYSKIYLPLPLLIVTAVSAVIIFQLLVVTVTHFPYYSEEFSKYFEQLSEQSEEQSSSSAAFFDTIAKLLHILTAVFVIAPVLSTILIVVLVSHLLYTIRKETILIRRGKSKFSITNKRVTSPSIKLTSSVRYCGFQIASIITGWMFYSIAFFSVGLFFVGIYVVPEIFGYVLYFIVITVLLVMIALVIEGLMCKFVFLTPESSQQKTIVINNRRVFNTFFYFVLLYNVATGLFTSSIRLMTSFLVTLLVKPRLDRVVFISPFQLLDTGHSMYKSFMITESLLHNPTVHVFVKLLSGKHYIGGENTLKHKPGYRYSQKARNRWFVAYTLLNNQSLIDKAFQESGENKDNTQDEITGEKGVDYDGISKPKVEYVLLNSNIED